MASHSYWTGWAADLHRQIATAKIAGSRSSRSRIAATLDRRIAATPFAPSDPVSLVRGPLDTPRPLSVSPRITTKNRENTRITRKGNRS